MTTSEALFDGVLDGGAILISCRSCDRSYSLPGDMIPSEGRDVICDACGEVWRVGADGLDTTWAGLSPSAPDPAWDAAPDELGYAGVVPHPALAPGRQSLVDRRDRLVRSMRTRWEAGRARLVALGGEVVRMACQAGHSVSAWQLALPAPRLRMARPKKGPVTGDEAARAFRARIRLRERNRLTPARLFGWGIWAGTLAGFGLVVTDEDTMTRVWPRTALLYEKLSRETAPDPFALANVSERFALSAEGPVLEIRGVVVNQGTRAMIPGLSLVPDGPASETAVVPTPLTSVPLPRGGERPFIVRAALPHGTRRAALHLSEAAPSREGAAFRLQQVGSGWGGGTPPLDIRLRASEGALPRAEKALR